MMDNINEYETTASKLHIEGVAEDDKPILSAVSKWNNRVFVKGSPEIAAYVWKKWKERDALIGYSYIRLGELVQVWRFERKSKTAIISITHAYNIKGWVLDKHKDVVEDVVIAKDAESAKRRIGNV